MDFRTPLAKVRGLGSAKEGTDHFWLQRLTAVANIPLVIFRIWLMVSLHGASYPVAVATLSSPFIALTLLAAITSILYHMRLGMQVVIEDYVHGELTKIILIFLNTFFVFAIGLTSAFAILRLAFGG